MPYIELEVPRAASASPQRQDTVEIGLLSDYDDLEAPSDDHSDILLVKLEGSSPGTPFALPGAGSPFTRNAKNIFLAAFLLVGGIFSVLFSQWLNYEKVAVDAEKDARFLRNKKAKKRLLKIMKGMCTVDLFCGILIMVGFFKIGASLFQIVSALGIPLTALMARFIIKRRLSYLQWLGIVVIVAGFSSNTIFPYIFAHQAGAAHLSAQQALASHNVSLGIILTVSGFLLGSGLGVGIEKLIHEPESPSPTRVCMYLGIYSTLLCVAVEILYVIPSRYHGIYAVLSSAAGVSGLEASKQAWLYLTKFIGGFVVLTLVHAYQNYSSYILIEAWGVIPMGILSASRSVVIMSISSFLYCKSDANQCFTSGKLTSAVIVTLGVLLYNLASFKAASSKS